MRRLASAGRARLLGALAAAGIAALCIRYVVLSFQWAQIWQIIGQADLLRLCLGGAAFTIAYWGVRALRWYCLLRALQAPVALADLYRCTALSLGFAAVTPLQSGEALKVEMLKRCGLMDRLPGYGVLLIERVTDLLVVLAMAAVAVAGDVAQDRERQAAAVAAAVVAALAFGGVLAVSRWRGGGALGELRDVLAAVGRGRTLCALVGLTALGWVLVAAAWQVGLSSVSVNVGLADAVGLMAVVTLANTLSLVPGAVGVAEAGTAALLIRQGFAPAAAQAGALALRAYGMLVLALALAHLAGYRAARRMPSAR